MRTIVTVFLVSILVASVYAECPDQIGYFSTQNGTMLGGRASEAWCAGSPGDIGNTENAMSWDGVALGTEWKVEGMAIASAPSIVGSSMDANNTGWVEYLTYYDGGTFWLSKDGPWGDGYSDLIGDVFNYSVTIRITYVMGNHVGSTSNIYFTGVFGACPESNGCILEFTIANAMGNLMADPAVYPDFLCGATMGEFFDVCCITTSINCAVPEKTTSFGKLKAQYR